MIMRRLVLFLTSFLFIVNIFAQSNPKIQKREFLIYKQGKSKAWRNVRYGNYFYEKGTIGDYLQALKYYKKAYQYNPNNPELNYKIGICYLKTLFKARALDYLQKVMDTTPNLTPDLLFYYAAALQYNYKFKQAIKYFNDFKKRQLYKTDARYKFFTDKRIEECKNGIELIKDTLPIVIRDLSTINSSYDDYGPVVTADGEKMYFTSRRPNGYNLTDQEGQYFDDIYYTMNDSGQWAKPKNAGPPLNTMSHDAVVGLSYDGQTMIIYRNGDLYWSKLDGKKWTDPKPFPKVINSKEIESSAALSVDGNTLYFVRGKKLDPLLSNGDIYYSTKDKNGNWSKPVPLPDNVNTPYDEDGLFLHPDGKTLYFSSKGHNSMGGYDVFKTVRQPDGSWSDPVNLGYPLNTPDDDIYFVLSGNAQVGYISAAREDTKGFTDIYSVHMFTADPYTTGENYLLAALAKPVEQTSFEPPVKLMLVKGKVVDKEGNPVEATVEIIDNKTGRVIYRVKTNSATGEYIVSLPPGHNYAMVIKKQGYMFHSENFDLEDDDSYNEVHKNFTLDTIAPQSKTQLRNIFFDFNSAKLKPESYAELNLVVNFLKNHPNLKVEISGHTDSLGRFDYNVKLSKLRAQAVVNYLVSKGIKKSRLVAKGYGPTKPIAPNSTPQGRALNRRVEIKILEVEKK